MSSDGERGIAAEKYRRIVSTTMDTYGFSLDEALELLNTAEPLREAVRSLFDAEDEREKHFYRPGATIPKSGPKAWSLDYESKDGYLWRRLRNYLIDRKHWTPKDVESLDESSDSVLFHLEDPKVGERHSLENFRVQGLVLGYVQSGKTANFTALISKAFDRGYRLIIVMSGVHNSLRAQTQRRLDLELGLHDDDKGVGLPPDLAERLWSITQAKPSGDFQPEADPRPLEQGIRTIMVIKKNATVLTRVEEWMPDDLPSDLPVLVIDDEADQASINNNTAIEEVDLGPDTGRVDAKHELDPTTINGLIRKLLKRFNRVSYVAYTATPFANVLIDPDSENDAWGADLFPHDFIISLPRPSAYVGAERLFGRSALDGEDSDIDGLNVVRTVPDAELLRLRPRAKSTAWTPAVTESLSFALLDWILATAGKEQRLGPGISSMLIHTTEKIAQQNALREKVDNALSELRSLWRYEREDFRATLRARWNEEFRPVTTRISAGRAATFEKIEKHVETLLESSTAVKVMALNSSTSETLDYESNPELKIILVGGNKLSRGLTLESLMVSFYVREINTYDTLLQMGRWFGYRNDFVDLTRLWTTSELISRFRHLSLVEEDLRDQIKIYETEPVTPRDVAPRIRAHPAMLATSRARMANTKAIRQSYAGELIQTTRFKLGDDNWLQRNFDCTKELLGSLPEPDAMLGPADNRPLWRDVPATDYIVPFLRMFRSEQAAASFDADTAASYIAEQANKHDELTHWNVVVLCGSKLNPLLGSCDFESDVVGPLPYISRSRLIVDDHSIGALVTTSTGDPSAADEAADLSTAQILAARESLARFPTAGHALRYQRPVTEGLLMIYPISPYSRPRDDASDRRLPLFDKPEDRPAVIGLALSFPPSSTGATVEYWSGPPSSHANRREQGE